MKIWAYQGPLAGRPLNVTDEEGQAAIDAGWAQPLRGQKLQKPDRVTENKAAQEFADQRAANKSPDNPGYDTREMRAAEPRRNVRQDLASRRSEQPQKPQENEEGSQEPAEGSQGHVDGTEGSQDPTEGSQDVGAEPQDGSEGSQENQETEQVQEKNEEGSQKPAEAPPKSAKPAAAPAKTAAPVARKPGRPPKKG